MSPPAPFSRGDYVRDQRGKRRLVHAVKARAGDVGVLTACCLFRFDDELTPASGDEPRQCPKCREAT